MPPVALASRLRRAKTFLTFTSVSHNLNLNLNHDLHPLTKRETLTRTNVITLAVFLVLLLFILLFFGIFLPRYRRQKQLKDRQQVLREMLTAEERAASRAGAGAGAGAAGRSRTGGGSSNAGAGAGQRRGGEAIPMDNMAVPDGDGGWVEPPPPYVADPKPAYHP